MVKNLSFVQPVGKVSTNWVIFANTPLDTAVSKHTFVALAETVLQVKANYQRIYENTQVKKMHVVEVFFNAPVL